MSRRLVTVLSVVAVVIIAATALAIITVRLPPSERLRWLTDRPVPPSRPSATDSPASPTARPVASSTAIPTGVDEVASSPNVPPAGSCHLGRDNRPDRRCTPGALNPRVTQDSIGTTICVPGWTATVRPPTSYTNKVKRLQIDAYGYADKRLSAYEEDHLMPLELGGAPSDIRNLWPEQPASPNPKDKDENRYHRDVCAGRMTLADAQRKIMDAWGPA